MTKHQAVPFFLHSTFRSHIGKQVKPYGLEWGIDGDSFLSFVPATLVSGGVLPDLLAPETRRGIVEAYNRWASAKELEFRMVEDISDLFVHKDGIHIQVEWFETHRPSQATQTENVEEALKKDPAANGGAPSEVWINGVYEGTLHGEMSLFPLLQAVKRVTGPGTQMYFRRSDKLIRIEKYFRGMLRKHQVFEHIMDNLVTLEDIEVIDSKTLIGTSTLGDWIMGGQLTSRLHIEEMDSGDLKFVRPLYNDDITTADRHFRLFNEQDNLKFSMVRKELDRLRFLATLKHPFDRRISSEIPDDSNHENDSKVILDRVPDSMDLSVSSSVIFVDDAERSHASSSTSFL